MTNVLEFIVESDYRAPIVEMTSFYIFFPGRSFLHVLAGCVFWGKRKKGLWFGFLFLGFRVMDVYYKL